MRNYLIVCRKGLDLAHARKVGPFVDEHAAQKAAEAFERLGFNAIPALERGYG